MLVHKKKKKEAKSEKKRFRLLVLHILENKMMDLSWRNVHKQNNIEFLEPNCFIELYFYSNPY